MAQQEPLDLFMESHAQQAEAKAAQDRVKLMQGLQVQVDQALGPDLLAALQKTGLTPWYEGGPEDLTMRDFMFHGESFVMAVDMNPLKNHNPFAKFILMGRQVGNSTEQDAVAIPNLTTDWFIKTLKHLSAPR